MLRNTYCPLCFRSRSVCVLLLSVICLKYFFSHVQSLIVKSETVHCIVKCTSIHSYLYMHLCKFPLLCTLVLHNARKKRAVFASHQIRFNQAQDLQFANCNQNMTCRNRPNSGCRVKKETSGGERWEDKLWLDWRRWGSAAGAVNLTCTQAKRRYRLPPQEPQYTAAGEKTASISEARLIHR